MRSGRRINKRLLKLIKSGQVIKFYHSREWRRKRLEILARDNYECQHCKVEGKVATASLEVHHIKHLDKHPLLGLDNANLVTVCTSCHNKEHPEKLESFKKSKPKVDSEERW